MKKTDNICANLNNWTLNAIDGSIAEIKESAISFASNLETAVIKIAGEAIELAFQSEECAVYAHYVDECVSEEDLVEDVDPCTFRILVPLGSDGVFDPVYEFNLREIIIKSGRYTRGPEYAEPLRALAKSLALLSADIEKKATEMDAQRLSRVPPFLAEPGQ